MRQALLVIPMVLAMTACSTLSGKGGYYKGDGPGDRARADLMRIPDAAPKPEPLSSSGNDPYTVKGKTYSPMHEASGYRERGIASWYGRKFHGRLTSSGEPYNMYAMTAAHRTLPLPSYVRVRNLNNGRFIVVRVNDRGPFMRNRLIDLSYAAAAKLGILGTGTGVVEVEAVTPGEPLVAAAKVIPSPKAAELPSTEPRSVQKSGGGATIELVSSARAAPLASGPESDSPRIYLQVGAFAGWGNAINLRTRLERAGFRPIFVQSILIPTSVAKGEARVYRVRIGPLKDVVEADRLTQELAQRGVPDALIVVE